MTEAATQWISYFNPTTRLSILAPDGWGGSDLDDGFRLWGPPETDDDYRSSLSFREGSPAGYPGGVEGLELLAEVTLSEMSEQYAGFALGAEDRFWLSSGVPVYVRRYEWEQSDPQRRFAQIQAFIDAESLIRVNMATLAQLSGQYLPVFETILRSTRIIPR
ncbi:MAG: hypothetical protein ACJAR2_000148 [Ilumatobacter sp.]|jgi:hypothetical protein